MMMIIYGVMINHHVTVRRVVTKLRVDAGFLSPQKPVELSRMRSECAESAALFKITTLFIEHRERTNAVPRVGGFRQTELYQFSMVI